MTRPELFKHWITHIVTITRYKRGPYERSRPKANIILGNKTVAIRRREVRKSAFLEAVLAIKEIKVIGNEGGIEESIKEKFREI